MADAYTRSNGTFGMSRLRRASMLALAQLGEATPLEIVDRAGLAREALQPRISELKSQGFISGTGARRPNPSGKSAAVLRLTEKGRAAL